jgi:hypothetical protein
MADTFSKSAVAGLASRMPVADRRVADAISRARQTQVASAANQSFIAGSNPALGGASPTAGAVSQAGAGVAAQAGQMAAQGAQANRATEQAAGQAAVAGQAQQAQTTAADMMSGLRVQQDASEDRLAKLNIGLKQQLVDDRIKFSRDQDGRMVANTQQLADLAVIKAKDQAELQKYKQVMDQATQKHIALLRIMHSKMKQQLENKTSKEIQELEQGTQVDLYRAMKDLESEIEAKEAEMANRSMQMGALGGVLGGVVGFFAGGPAGAAKGAQTGHGVGSAAAYS